jgi:hypothetical protein
MKRVAWLLAVLLCSSALLYAGNKDKKEAGGKSKMMSMTGMVCSDKCVDTTASKASCKKDCSETGGDMVFVDSKGKVYKVDNQDKVAGMGGKKVKVKGGMMAGDMMHIYEIAPVTY